MTSTALPATPRAHPRAPAPRAARRIRVAFCIDHMGPGGTEFNAVRTAERLDRERFDVTVVTFRPDGMLAPRYAAAGIAVVSFPLTSFFGLGALRQAARLARFLAAGGFDVAHCHDRYTNVFVTLAARAARTPAIIASKRWWRLPRGHEVANAVAYRLAHRVLANSHAVAASAGRVERVRLERVAVIPNFVDEEAFVPMAPEERRRMLADMGVPDGALVAGIVARLRPVKDHESLIRAAALLRPRWPALHLVLVGEGPSQPELEALARALGVHDVVHFAGHREQQPNPNDLFDVAVLCSLQEGFPNAVVEAMAAARPVVATSVGGASDAVEHGETGLLVPPRQPAQLAAALETLLDDPALRARMGAAGQRRARERYHASSVIPRLEALYEELLGRR
jgi:glycosyltransferase involved in cell wall biosynthesis